MISTALYFALLVIFLGLELISLNHTLMGLILIAVYVGAIIILMVFMIMNLDLEHLEKVNVNIIFGIIVWYFFKDNSLLFSINITDYYLNYNLGSILFSENPLIAYMLVILLLLALVTSVSICKRC